MDQGYSESARLEFEKEKFLKDLSLREREILLKEQDLNRSKWNNPLVLAATTAALALSGNLLATWFNNNNQLRAERSKSEATLILEMIKTADPVKATNNLKFLVEAGLVSDPDQVLRLNTYFQKRKPAEGPVLPSDAPTPSRNPCAQVSSNARKIVAESRKIPIASVSERTNLRNNPKVDDLDIVEIVMQAEETFNVEISDSVRDSLVTVGDLTKYIRSQLECRTSR